jgi:RHS repeat-associated protein
VRITRSHEAVLVNNVLTGNGVASGSTGGRFGLSREGSTSPQPAGIRLLNNLICGNRLGEIEGPVLDATDSGNLTPTGAEGPGVAASPGCETPATVYEALAGADGVAGTVDDDFQLAPGSPALDAGMDPRTLGLSPLLNPLFETDFSGVPSARPKNATGAPSAQFDMGAFEAEVPDDVAPAVTFVRPEPSQHVRGVVPVEVTATDAGSGVVDFILTVEGHGVTTTLTPTVPPPAPSVTATASWATSGLTDGAHTITATATDAAGNAGSATRVAIVDNTPPETAIDSGPGGEIAAADATFTFSGTDNLAPVGGLTFAWRLGGGEFTEFSEATTATFTGLGEGTYTFEVKARDLAGNEDPAPATRTFTVRFGPAITAVDPGTGVIGTLVTITGQRFEPGATTVSFNGLAATIRTITPTTITTTVPIGAASGPLVVTTTRGVASHPFTVTLTGEFTLTTTPGSVSVIAGDQTAVAVGAAGSGAFTSLVGLAVTPAVTGFTPLFSAPFLAPGASTSLTLRADAALAPGTYNFTVTGQAQVDGRPATRTASFSLEVLPANTTAVTGRIMTAEAIPLPIPGVTVTLGTAFVQTDPAGNFTLLAPPSGQNLLFVDGRTASTPAAQFPIVEVQVMVNATGPTRVPFTIYLPVLDTGNPINLPLDAAGFTTQEVIATTPRVPGLEVTIPQGTRIVGPDGNPVAQLVITPVPIDRSPMPFPPGKAAPLLFAINPGGAVPSQPLPISFPNVTEAAPGTTADMYYFDLAIGDWNIWGTGTVSADGTQVVSDPGSGLPRLAWHWWDIIRDGLRRLWKAVTAGDPVDLATGIFSVDKTDLVLPGRIPVTIQRSYRSGDTRSGLFGIGWNLGLYDSRLTSSGATLNLITSDQNRFQLRPGAPGQWTSSESVLLGAVVTQLPGEFNFQIRYKDGTVHRYERIVGFANTAGLAAITDPNGNTVTITRISPAPGLFGLVSRITEPAGRTLDFTYDAVGRITSIKDPLGRTVRYTYDAQGRLDTVTDAGDGLTRYTYDAAHRIETITDPRNITFLTNEYDAQGRVIRQTQADGGVWEFAYTLTGGALTETAVTDPRGGVTRHRFNDQGIRLATTDALGQTTTFEYAPGSNLLVATIDPLGRIRRFTHDAAGNVQTITDPAGQVTTFTYDATFNRVTSITDALQQITEFRYDANGNLTEVENPLDEKTTITYNAAGQPTSIADPLQNTTTFGYDAHGNLATVTDPLQHVTRRAYDAASRLTAQTDPRGTVTLFQYDRLNRLTELHQGRGSANLTRMLLDDTFDTENGGAASLNYANLANWNITRGCVDLIGNGSFDLFPGNGLYLDLDGSCGLAGRIESKTQFALEPGTYELTFSLGGSQRGDTNSVTVHLGEVLTETFTLPTNAGLAPITRSVVVSAPTTARLIFDHAGADNIGLSLDRVRLLAPEVSEPDAIVTRFVYDPNGNLRTVTDARNNVTEYTYDRMERVETRKNPLNAVESFVYDGLGNLLRHTDRKQQQAIFGYDALNRAISGTYADGTRTSFTYDAMGRVSEATDSADGMIQSQYDPLDRLVAQATALGTVSYQYDALGRRTQMATPGQAPVTYNYDAASRLTAITQGAQLASLMYDAAGRRTRLTLPNGVATEYQYDIASQLTALIYRNETNVLGNLTYNYDAAGRLTRVGGSFARTGLPSPVATTQYDAANRQLMFGDRAMTYDANGNLTTLVDAAGQSLFTWDARNRLTALSAPGPTTAAFAYDPLGRRNSRAVNGVVTAYLYDALDVVQEQSGGGAVAYLRTLAIDEALVRGGEEFLLAGALGSTVALTTAAGAVQQQYTYEPFGGTTASGAASGNSITYTGRDDDAAGLKYYRARFYHPRLQRFISEDPVGFSGGDPNFYAYVGNNPLSFRDPTGEFAVALAPAVIGGAAVVALWLASPEGQQAARNAAEAATELAAAGTQATADFWIAISSTLKGDDPGYGSEDERRRAIEEAQKILRDPSASQRDKSKAKRRIEELSRRRSKRAHGGDKLIAIDPTLDVISIQAPPRLGCRKVCE